MKKNNKKNAKKFNQQHPFTQKEQHKNVDFIIKNYNSSADKFKRWIENESSNKKSRVVVMNPQVDTTSNTLTASVKTINEFKLIVQIINEYPFAGVKLSPPEQLMDSLVPKEQMGYLGIFCAHIAQNFNDGSIMFPRTIANLNIDYNSRDVVSALSAAIQKCTYVILRDLDIRSLKHYNCLIKNCPAIEAIDITANKLERVDEFSNIRGLKLKILNVAGNPFTNTLSPKDVFARLKGYFPSIVMTDGYKDLNLFPVFLKLQRFPPSQYGSCYEFKEHPNIVKSVIAAILKPWELQEDRLGQAYAPNSCFSVSVCGKVRTPRPFSAIPNDAIRNVAGQAETTEVAVGPHDIFLLMKKMPQINVEMERCNIAADTMNLGDSIIIMHVYGNCYVAGARAIFTRTIIFDVSVSRIINDMICFHDLKSDLFIANAPPYGSQQQQQQQQQQQSN